MPNEERKERVIHTRIPAGLEDQIKRLAEGLRVPVSNLVRNMLEDAIDAATRLRDRVPPSQHLEIEDVYGWQPLTMNIDVQCSRCGQSLHGGDQAYLGLTDRPHDARVFICPACLPRPGQDPNP